MYAEQHNVYFIKQTDKPVMLPTKFLSLCYQIFSS